MVLRAWSDRGQVGSSNAEHEALFIGGYAGECYGVRAKRILMEQEALRGLDDFDTNDRDRGFDI
jgi:hypothetical protein